MFSKNCQLQMINGTLKVNDFTAPKNEHTLAKHIRTKNKGSEEHPHQDIVNPLTSKLTASSLL